MSFKHKPQQFLWRFVFKATYLVQRLLHRKYTRKGTSSELTIDSFGQAHYGLPSTRFCSSRAPLRSRRFLLSFVFLLNLKLNESIIERLSFRFS
jgi:hypothetical protein